jgi:shikimate dehydrogenase
VQAFIRQGGRGCNVTVPFKFEAAALATRSSERALLAQASNLPDF